MLVWAWLRKFVYQQNECDRGSFTVIRRPVSGRPSTGIDVKTVVSAFHRQPCTHQSNQKKKLINTQNKLTISHFIFHFSYARKTSNHFSLFPIKLFPHHILSCSSFFWLVGRMTDCLNSISMYNIFNCFLKHTTLYFRKMRHTEIKKEANARESVGADAFCFLRSHKTILLSC